MASLRNRVAVKEEVEDPQPHIPSSLRQFPTRQEGTHGTMMTSTAAHESAGSGRARGAQAKAPQLPMAAYFNAIFQRNRAHMHRNQSTTLSAARPPKHAPMSLSNGDGRGSTKCCGLFTLKLTQDHTQILNWLAIPAEPAKRFFPDVPHLIFWDQESRRWWRFQYCRSRDGRSYVLLSGWSSFAKEKALKTDDTLSFNLFIDDEILENSYYMIDVRRTGRKKEQLKLFGVLIDID